jgi:uncharacterized membrane protein
VTAAAEVTVELSRPAAAALLELVTKNPELLPPEQRVPLRAALAAAVHLEGRESGK